jgi:hypothetical protein
MWKKEERNGLALYQGTTFAVTWLQSEKSRYISGLPVPRTRLEPGTRYKQEALQPRQLTRTDTKGVLNCEELFLWYWGVQQTVVCHWMWSRNLKNEAALAHIGLLRQRKWSKTTANLCLHLIAARCLLATNPGLLDTKRSAVCLE